MKNYTFDSLTHYSAAIQALKMAGAVHSNEHGLIDKRDYPYIFYTVHAGPLRIEISVPDDFIYVVDGLKGTL